MGPRWDGKIKKEELGKKKRNEKVFPFLLLFSSPLLLSSTMGSVFSIFDTPAETVLSLVLSIEQEVARLSTNNYDMTKVQSLFAEMVTAIRRLGNAPPEPAVDEVIITTLLVTAKTGCTYPPLAFSFCGFAMLAVDVTRHRPSPATAVLLIDVIDTLVGMAHEFTLEQKEYAQRGEPIPPGSKQEHALNFLGDFAPVICRFLLPNALAFVNRLREHADMMSRLDRLRWRSGGLKQVHRLLSVVYGERFLVIHTEEKKGFVVSVSGVTDIFQLHSLLMDVLCRLPEDRKLQGDPLYPEILAMLTTAPLAPNPPIISGRWQLSHWTGVFTTDFDKSHLFGEGVPLDVLKFRDRERVILLSTSTIDRSWNVCREFPLQANVVVDRVLTSEEVLQHLDDFRAATEAEKAAAVEQVVASLGGPFDNVQFELVPFDQAGEM